VQRQVGITFVYVTHDQEEALTMSDRIAVLSQGRIEQIGAPAEVYERPQTAFVAGFIGVSNLIERDGHTITVRPEKITLLEDGGELVVSRQNTEAPAPGTGSTRVRIAWRPEQAFTIPQGPNQAPSSGEG
jgi:putative spermidine/putrescine transport system ATP-binding protein